MTHSTCSRCERRDTRVGVKNFPPHGWGWIVSSHYLGEQEYSYKHGYCKQCLDSFEEWRNEPSSTDR